MRQGDGECESSVCGVWLSGRTTTAEEDRRVRRDWEIGVLDCLGPLSRRKHYLLGNGWWRSTLRQRAGARSYDGNHVPAVEEHRMERVVSVTGSHPRGQPCCVYSFCHLPGGLCCEQEVGPRRKNPGGHTCSQHRAAGGCNCHSLLCQSAGHGPKERLHKQHEDD